MQVLYEMYFLKDPPPAYFGLYEQCVQTKVQYLYALQDTSQLRDETKVHGGIAWMI